MSDSTSHTALLAAIDSGRIEELHELLDAGADANAFVLHDPNDPKSRLPALYRASIAVPDDEACAVAMVKLLLERGAEPNDGESIYHAAEMDRREVLAALVAGGADPGSRHRMWNNTPLYFLAGYHRWDEKRHAATRGMRWLLEHGADPNVTSYDSNETPLHRFAFEGREPEAIEMLLEHGATIDARRADGKTPYALAVRGGWVETANELARRGAAAEPSVEDRFLGAARRGDLDEARGLLAAHPDLRASLAAEPEWTGTPLHWAAWQGKPVAAAAFVALGAPLNHRDREFGSNPIAWACHGSVHCRTADADYVAVVELLLDAGSDREASINRWGDAPESMAAPAVAEVLMRRGFAAAGGHTP